MATADENLVKLSQRYVERVFDSLDYGNQRDILLCLAEVQEANKSRYTPKLVQHIKSHPQLGAIIHLDNMYAQSRRMAMKLTEMGRKATLQELMGAAA